MDQNFSQSQMNIGTLGHVDHGKTTLTKAITGVWTDKHSESLKRSMTIKLGYADAIIKKCEKCKDEDAFTVREKCEHCNSVPAPYMRISILDAPGHETLMATAISGSNLIDAVLFVIASTEPCPMPQTKEHLALLNILGVKNIIIVQSKIDIVGKARAKEHYNEIKRFVKGSIAENAHVVPVIANKEINIDSLLYEISKVQLPKRDVDSDPFMYIVRSFDANRPGTKIEKLVGGVVGGSIVHGKLKPGDEIEIRPGIVNKQKNKKEYEPVLTRIESLSTSTGHIKEAIAGGLIAVGTEFDPSFSKADGLVGNVIGKAGKLPQTRHELNLEYKDIVREDLPKRAFVANEPIILGVGTATVVGYATPAKKGRIKVMLKSPVCVEKGAKVSILRNMSQRWRLSGYGITTE